jgi:putative DNA primase/helicase
VSTAEAWAPDVPAAPRVVDIRDPLSIARQFIADQFTADQFRTLHAWRGDLRRWSGRSYAIMEEAAMRAAVYGYLERTVRAGDAKRIGGDPVKPNAALVSNVIDALRAAAHLDDAITAPSWLAPSALSPHELLPLRNGLLNLKSKQLLQHTPEYFNTHAVDCDYDPAALLPEELLGFLATVWPEDDQAVLTLQEVFGYILSGDTRMQKAVMIVGPKRAGKGTIGRLLRRLVGEQNVVVPTLSSLAGPFGLQPLIDKSLAIISDARLSGRTDQTAIVERLLAITGEDAPAVDRKHQPTWHGALPTRFMLLTNELPRIADSSGAFASRFIVLQMTQSFYGQEDLDLDRRLATELTAILRWSLEGLERLRRRGHFILPDSSEDAVRELEDLGSPVGAFVRDQLVIEVGAETDTNLVYERWRRWCEEHGRSTPSTEQVFGRDLRAVIPGLTTGSRRASGERFRAYLGIRLREGVTRDTR